MRSSHRLTGLSPATRYYYRVRGTNSGGEGGNSNTVSVMTLPLPPPAPVARPATAITGSGFTAHWDSSASAAGYRLDVATDSLFAGGFLKNDTAAGNALALTVSGLTPGTAYYYRVRAFNSGGTGAELKHDCGGDSPDSASRTPCGATDACDLLVLYIQLGDFIRRHGVPS